MSATLNLAVLGGSSPATPVLIEALRSSQRAGRLGEIEVRLHGRNLFRLQRVSDFAAQRLCSEVQLPALTVVPARTLTDALQNATHILCMVRPGGMAGRAHDESLARRAGTPADEGLGVGGLSCFLRGRETIIGLAEACARSAPRAHLLQMSSPLGLTVALSRRVFGDRAFGVCELPLTTATKLRQLLPAEVCGHWRSHSHAGLNHQSWMYDFRDAAGREVTAAVIGAIPSRTSLGVETRKIVELGAVPVHYLRLFLHMRREVAAQRGTMSRGKALARWSQRVENALCAGTSPDARRVEQLLAQRRMDWFDEGVLPVLEALQGEGERSIPLNVPAGSSMAGACGDAIVEIDCNVSRRGVHACAVPPLPPGPAALTRQLLDYERAALALPAEPAEHQIAEVLACHPLAPRTRIRELARNLRQSIARSSTAQARMGDPPRLRPNT